MKMFTQLFIIFNNIISIYRNSKNAKADNMDRKTTTQNGIIEKRNYVV